MSWPQIKNIVVLKFHFLLFCAATTNCFLIGLWCGTKSEFYMTTSNVQLSGWTEKKLQSTSQSKTCTNETSWSLVGGLLPIWSTTVFWNLVKPLHLRSMLSKSMRCTENCNTRSQHWSTERARFFTTMLEHTSHNQRFKSWTNWAMKFCLIHHIYLTSHQLTSHHFFKYLNKCFQGKCFHNLGGRKCFPRGHRIPRHGFYSTGINKLIFHQQKCVDSNGSYFD